ncbi:unnamed protein product, partial [Ectocarpus sp. 6 AP-2014]
DEVSVGAGRIRVHQERWDLERERLRPRHSSHDGASRQQQWGDGGRLDDRRRRLCRVRVAGIPHRGRRHGLLHHQLVHDPGDIDLHLRRGRGPRHVRPVRRCLHR